MTEETSESMDDLSESQQEALIECLAALEAGADIEACLASRPEHAETLRPLLEVRARLLAPDIPTAPPGAFQAGREALLERVTGKPVSRSRWPLAGVRWPRLPSPLAQAAAAGAVLLVLAGGALGASAGAGFEPARDVISALPVIDLPPSDEGPAGGQGGGASPTQARGGTPAAPGSTGVGGRQPQEIPGLGLCFAEGEVQHRAGTDELLERVPDVGLCIPEALLGRSEDGRACVPQGTAQRLADVVDDQLGDLPLCGPADTGQPPNGGDMRPTAERPGGPPPAATATAPLPGAPQGPMPMEEHGEQQGPSDGFSAPSDGAPQGPSGEEPEDASEGTSQAPPGRVSRDAAAH